MKERQHMTAHRRVRAVTSRPRRPQKTGYFPTKYPVVCLRRFQVKAWEKILKGDSRKYPKKGRPFSNCAFSVYHPERLKFCILNKEVNVLTGRGHSGWNIQECAEYENGQKRIEGRYIFPPSIITRVFVATLICVQRNIKVGASAARRSCAR